jgi:hypothetical protein
MNKETTPFFFTNFPVETQVGELWTLFAKFGRIGEVYIPSKLDKRGNRFGFVKFKEVKNVEALSERLEDVWLGSYKLRVNLSRFGRNSSKGEPSKDSGGQAKEKRPSATVTGGAKVYPDKPFLNVLLGAHPDHHSLPSIEGEVDQEFLHILSGSYVGVMTEGVETRAVQMKLWLAGLHSVRAVPMGGRLILLFRNSGDDVGDPVRNKMWWGDLIKEIRAWSPNQVSTRKEVWVSMYGIPLHAWGESTFRKLASRCGAFLAIDDGTRDRLRFDVARVKIDSAINGRIDFAVKLRIQGAGYVIRIVEEGGGVMGEEVLAEDQLRRSEVGSSCASGGHGSVRAVLEGLDGVDSESDASEGYQVAATVAQEVCQKRDKYQGFGKLSDNSGGGTGDVRFIPRMTNKQKGTTEVRPLEMCVGVRGSKPFVGEESQPQWTTTCPSSPAVSV